MQQEDLFGNMSEVSRPVKKGWMEVKRIRNYREADRDTPEKDRQSCKNCEHLVRKDYAKRYYKCAIMSMKASPSSDVRLKCVCDLYEPEK